MVSDHHADDSLQLLIPLRISRFVHESWMTPSVFDCAAGDGIGEIDIAHGWGSIDSARAVLERHWDTFITVSDFEWLSRTGHWKLESTCT